MACYLTQPICHLPGRTLPPPQALFTALSTFDHFYVSKAPHTFPVLPRPKQKEDKIELQISEKANHDKKILVTCRQFLNLSANTGECILTYLRAGTKEK